MTNFLHGVKAVSEHSLKYSVNASANKHVLLSDWIGLHRCMSVFVWENWFEKNCKLNEPLLVSTIRLLML